jgi:hypothetical protein
MARRLSEEVARFIQADTAARGFEPICTECG